MEVVCYLLSHRNPTMNVWEPVRMASREVELEAFVDAQPGANDWHIRTLSFDMDMFDKACTIERNAVLEEGVRRRPQGRRRDRGHGRHQRAATRDARRRPAADNAQLRTAPDFWTELPDVAASRCTVCDKPVREGLLYCSGLSQCWRTANNVPRVDE